MLVFFIKGRFDINAKCLFMSVLFNIENYFRSKANDEDDSNNDSNNKIE